MLRTNTVCCGVIVLAAGAQADTLNVPADYPTIQAAIDAATNGDEVAVADGLYTGDGNTNLKFLGKAITLRSANGPAHCRLDANHQARLIDFKAGDSPLAVVDGLTLTRGLGDGATIRVTNASPTIRNCIITDSYGFNFGSGMLIWGASHPTIENCHFSHNYTDWFEGTVYVLDTSSVTLTNCVFSGNYGAGSAHAVTTEDNATASITDCVFAGAKNAAIEVLSGTQAVVRNCVLTGNGQATWGAGNVTIINCTAMRNTGSNAAVFAVSGGGSTALLNTVLWGNSGSLNPQSNVYVETCIIEGGWSGSGGDVTVEDPGTRIVAGGSWTQAPVYDPAANMTAFIDANAAFIPGALTGTFINPDTKQGLSLSIVSNTATSVLVYGEFTETSSLPNPFFLEGDESYEIYDLRPSSGSSAVDSGNNYLVPRGLLTDIDGNPRFVDDPATRDTGQGRRGPIVDIGAYELQSPLLGDIDGDGAINGADLGLLLAAWNTAEPSADLNEDGNVDGVDLGLLLANWTG